MIKSNFYTQQIYPPAGQIVANVFNEEEQQKKKLTFEEWWENNSYALWSSNYDNHYEELVKEVAFIAWKAAQENA